MDAKNPFNYESSGRGGSLGQTCEARKTRQFPTLRPLRQADVNPRLVELTELGADDCHYPYNDSGNFRFCGLGRQTGSSYCPKHHALTTYDTPPLSDKFIALMQRK
jgi:hypothetical protein